MYLPVKETIYSWKENSCRGKITIRRNHWQLRYNRKYESMRCKIKSRHFSLRGNGKCVEHGHGTVRGNGKQV